MSGCSTLAEIEADLKFCEDVLNNRPPRSSGHGAAAAHRVTSSCAPVAVAASPARRRTPPRQSQAQAHAELRQLKSLQQPCPMPAQQTQAAQQAAQQAQPAPTARTTEELLALLSSVPEGQPFEIDTRLLYSPQSSFNASVRNDSPSGHSSSHVSIVDELLLQYGGGGGGGYDDRASGGGNDTSGAGHYFSPPTRHRGYPASAAGSIPGTTSEPRRSQQHAVGPPANPQQGHWPGGSSGHGQDMRALGGSAAAAGMRPASAPQQGAGGGRSGSARPVPARQLLLDDALENGVKGRTAGLLRQGREARLQQLAQPRTGLWERCAHIRMQEEHAELQECTFAPKTGRPPSRQRVAPGVPVEERLQLVARGREEARARARSELEKGMLADCTFSPQLLTQPERHLRQEYTPLHRRLGEEQRRRSTKMAQARMEQELGDGDLTFQPQLNKRSLRLAADKEARELFKDPAQQRPRSAGPTRSGSADGGGKSDSSNFRFCPAINPTSERLLEDSSTVPTDFQERQRYYLQRKQQRQRAAAEADAGACTFRPDTGNAVEVLALSASRAGNLLETEQERYDRLALEEAQRLAARRAAKEAEVYGGLDFTPKLNQRSLALAPAGSGGVEALASAEKQRQRLAELQRAEEERQRAECTFRPDTRKPRVKGYYDEYQPPQPSARISIAHAAKQGFEGLTQRIADYQAEKDARAAAVKAKEEARRLRECSFVPEINHRRVEAKGPVVVRGLDRFIEVKQLAQRQQQEAEERAARVFNQNPRTKQGATVPQPFRLAGHALLEAKAAEKQAALLESQLCDRMRDCTFHPHTNHQHRQQQLQRILVQPSLSDTDFSGAF